jgi:hypothetical protein
MSVTNYNVFNYLKSVNGFGLPVSNTIYSATLTAHTEETLAVPLAAGNGSTPTATVYNKYLAEINSSGSIWVAVNQTAAVPAGAAFAATTSKLIFNDGIYVKSGDVIHIISEAAADVSVSFYALQDL